MHENAKAAEWYAKGLNLAKRVDKEDFCRKEVEELKKHTAELK